MAYEKRDNSGSVFVNDRKERDNQPDRTGSCMIDGVEYWINGWVKKDKNGNPWMSLAFKRKDAPSGKAPPAPAQPALGEDDIPF
jgi:hypothetical protein